MVTALKVLSFPLVLSLALASGSVLADPDAPTLSRERLRVDTAREITRDGQQFRNSEQNDQLRHRVNEQFPDDAKKTRSTFQEQQGKQSKHQYQYREQSSGQHRHQSGSPGRSAGMGGNGRGR